jgi:CRISPR-associated protein Cas5t
MLGLYVTVPIACFRKGMAREYLETELIPPPSTCYGFLLSFVGETDRTKHGGVRVTCGVIGQPFRSVVLRTVWRVKSKPLGSSGNTRPDYQQLLTNLRIVIWIDSQQEDNESLTLESRVSNMLDPKQRSEVDRFGGLSLGESTHLVDEILPISVLQNRQTSEDARLFVLNEKGRMTLPVWVDHVGSSGTRYTTGDLVTRLAWIPPSVQEIPTISAM